MHHTMLLIYCSLPGYSKLDVISLGDVGIGFPSYVPDSEAVLEAPQPEYREWSWPHTREPHHCWTWT